MSGMSATGLQEVCALASIAVQQSIQTVQYHAVQLVLFCTIQHKHQHKTKQTGQNKTDHIAVNLIEL